MAKRPDADLLRASEDLYYEYDMVRQLAALLSTADPETVETNARLEAFLGHVRNLMVFLKWYKSNHPDDVRATHYFQKWQPNLPGNAWVDDAYTEVCNRVTHLSFNRLGPVKKQWPIREITEVIETEVRRFIGLAPARLLCARWRQRMEYVFSAHSPVFPSVATGISQSVTLLNTIPKKSR